MRISDWSSDVCSSDLEGKRRLRMSRYMVTTAAAALLALAATNAQADIRIATAGPMTGQYASFGEQLKKGAEAAVRDIHPAGGLLCQKQLGSSSSWVRVCPYLFFSFFAFSFIIKKYIFFY